MNTINNIFDSLGVPEKCRDCPTLGAHVTEYYNTEAVSRIIAEEVVNSEWDTSLAVQLAEGVGITYEQALEYIQQPDIQVDVRQKAAKIIRRQEVELSARASHIADLVVDCNGPTFVERPSGTETICNSPNNIDNI